MSQEQESNRYLVPGLQRGLEILRMFRRSRPILAAPEIAQELAIPRTTVFRLLQTLEQSGFVVRTGGDREYRLGLAVLSLGFEYLASQDLTDLASPILQRLRDSTGCATHLVIRDGRDVLYLLRFPGISVINSSISVGTRLPAHATVMGRLFLADLTARELAELYPETRLETYTPQTPRTPSDLTRLLAGDLGRGYLVSEGYYEKGINAVAAPVRDRGDRVIAAINLIAREGEADSKRLHGELVSPVLAAAAELSASLDNQRIAAV